MSSTKVNITIPNDPGNSTPPAARFLVVGIGASAGGADACGKFFHQMPADSGMSFVVIQHLDPHHPSILNELLSHSTQMTVSEAVDGETVQPNQVYVIPPNKSITIKSGILHLAPRPTTVPHVPIDRFFESLAEDCREYAACIVMTGAGTDGTVGLRAIKANGGLAIAQTPDTTQFDSMPRSAISTGVVDHVLDVELIPECLQRYFSFLLGQTGDESADDRQQDLECLGLIHGILRRHVGHDFSHYKEATILRRIRRRMQILQCNNMSDYVAAVHENGKEAEALLNDLLIGVTNFFRDSEAFSVLSANVVSKLLANRQEDDPIRIWVPACSTGEEAYSIAMLFDEHAQGVENSPPIKIFATDISEPMLAKARMGRYPEGIAAHVTPERLKKYFIHHGDVYQVSKSIREMCVFSAHSLLKHPPFSKLDLISCRNMLIYMDSELQNRIISLFHYALKPEGFLFLGSSETTAAQEELFLPIDKRHRLYVRQETGSRTHVSLPLLEPAGPISTQLQQAAQQPPPGTSVQSAVDRFMLDQYSTPCILISAQHEILHVSGRTGKYLEITTGAPTRNIMDLVRKRLRIELRAALHRVATSGETVVYENVAIRINDQQQNINLVVRPANELSSEPGAMLIIFQELGTPHTPLEHNTEASALMPDEAISLHLEHELKLSRDRLQTTTEEFETTNEELKSSNEELQSMNEELQASNEAMQSSKEELQSINEELETVNNELLNKIDELDRANSDLQNVFENTNVATIFLDSELRISSYTPAARELFRLIGSDVGRSIRDIQSNFREGDLDNDIRKVMATLDPRIELIHKPHGDRWYYMTIRPYRGIDGTVDGTVLNFIDVTELKLAEDKLRKSEQNLRMALKSAVAGTWSIEAKTGLCEWSEEFLELYGLPPNMACTHYGEWIKSVLPDDQGKLEAGYRQIIEKELTEFHVEYRINHPVKGTRWILTTGRIDYDESQQPVKVSGISVDVTSRVMADEERAIQDKLRETQKIESMNILAGGIAHDFNNLLLGILGNTSILSEQLSGQAHSEIVHEIEIASRRASDLCLQMLAFSGKGKFVVRPININDLVNEVRESVKTFIAPGINIDIAFEENLPTVEADATQIRQVIMNLLTNAAESIESHQGVVHVTTGRITLTKEDISICISNEEVDEGEFVTVKIKDTGHGMKPEVISRIFEPFYTTKFTGRGLGLSAVLGIVRSHHGCMSIDSTPGKGTTFTVFLPACATQSAGLPIDAPPQRKWKKTGTILVVDDSDVARRTLLRMLEKEGFKVLLAEDGIEGVDVLRKNLAEVNLVLLDLTMPRMDGIEAFREMRKLNGDLRVVLSSGYNESEVGQSIAGLGFVGFLQKPYRQEELAYLTHSLIEDKDTNLPNPIPTSSAASTS